MHEAVGSYMEDATRRSHWSAPPGAPFGSLLPLRVRAQVIHGLVTFKGARSVIVGGVGAAAARRAGGILIVSPGGRGREEHDQAQ